MKILMPILWVIILTIIGILTSIGFENSVITKVRLIIPLLGMLLVFGFELLWNYRFEYISIIIIRRLFAFPFLVLGFNWICIFTLTTYRSHHRLIIIPLSIVFIIIGLALTHYQIYLNNETGTESRRFIRTGR